MKKAIFSLMVICGLLIQSEAQDWSYEQGNILVNAGVGLGNLYWGSGFESSFPVNPTAAVEYGVSDRISVGLGAGYSSVELGVDGFDKIKYTGLAISARGSYHFATSEKFDPYFGLSLGYVNVGFDAGDDDDIFGSTKASGIGWGGYIGARYYFSSTFGAFAELGATSFSILSAGVALKF